MNLELSSSRIGSFMTCPQKHEYQHTLGRVTLKASEALSFGRLWHKLMEAWWHPEHNGRASTYRLNAAMAVFEGDIDPFERAKAAMMLAGYTARWGDESIETVAVELAFSVPLIDPENGDESEFWKLCGTIDKVVKKDGKLYLVEHKTSSDDATPGSDYWRRLALDTQVSNYYIGARQAGFDVLGCLYDVAVKPAIRPLKATPEDKRKFTKTGQLYANQRDRDETPDEYGQRILAGVSEHPNDYFVRGEVSRLAEALDRARRDVWEIAYTMEVQMEAGMAPRNTRACRGIGGGLCEYFDVCAGAAELSDPTRFKNTDYRPSGKNLVDPDLGF